MRTWVFLLYRLPTEPSARRVHVWRKLKGLGAILLENAVWALPGTPALIEQFQWLAQEILEAGGSASVWQAQAGLVGQDEALARRFMAQAEAAYAQIQCEIEQNTADLQALARRYRLAERADHFHVESGEGVRRALERARGEAR
jgi:hypothetical protein